MFLHCHILLLQLRIWELLPPDTHPENAHIFNVAAVSVRISHGLKVKQRGQRLDITGTKKRVEGLWRGKQVDLNSRFCVRLGALCAAGSRTSSWSWSCWTEAGWGCRTRRWRLHPPYVFPWWWLHSCQGNSTTLMQSSQLNMPVLESSSHHSY